VRGPLNIARSVQGWPVVVDVKGRWEKAGRARDHMKILSATFFVVGDTVEEARAKRAKLDSLVDYANAIASLSIALGHDASKFDPDGPLPDISESNESKSARERAIAMARRDNLTARQLAQRLGGYGGLAMVGTPGTIADEMEEWLTSDACDGFIIMFPYLFRSRFPPTARPSRSASVIPFARRRARMAGARGAAARKRRPGKWVQVFGGVRRWEDVPSPARH
jgi:alkanesulfonate monooxygenase SsuD/methylene tetrahydromethanopterin reductase-like flavin-dependent oxidoreductase (luciferase family)